MYVLKQNLLFTLSLKGFSDFFGIFLGPYCSSKEMNFFIFLEINRVFQEFLKQCSSTKELTNTEMPNWRHNQRLLENCVSNIL